MTGEWEFRLKQMAHGKLDRRHFMEDIRGLTRDIVERVRNFRGETIEGEYATIDAKCPNCGGGPIKEDYKTFRCQNCDWLMWKTMASRQFEPEEVHELLAKGGWGRCKVSAAKWDVHSKHWSSWARKRNRNSTSVRTALTPNKRSTRKT